MNDGGDTGSSRELRQQMEAALREVRRECYKAAFLQAIVDAVAVFLIVNLILASLNPSWLPAPVSIPSGPSILFTTLSGQSPTVIIPASALLACGVGLIAILVSLWIRLRRPLVEQYESVNPQVAEALRTTRDTVDRNTDSEMVTRLYKDVLDKLQQTSSLGLINLRRMGATLLFIVALSTVTTQVAVQGVTFTDNTTVGATNSTEIQTSPVGDSELKGPEEVLGESETVSAGDENLSATIESTGGNQEVEASDQFPTTGDQPRSGVTQDIDSQQAGFAQQEKIENAKLVRKYNTRIREIEES